VELLGFGASSKSRFFLETNKETFFNQSTYKVTVLGKAIFLLSGRDEKLPPAE
jgi:hypothetical protein